MSNFSEREARARILAEVPANYYGVFVAYEAFLVMLNVQKRAYNGQSSPEDLIMLGDHVAERLANIVGAISETKNIDGEKLLVSDEEEMEKTGFSYCYNIGFSGGGHRSDPWMTSVKVAQTSPSLIRRALLGEKTSWRIVGEQDYFRVRGWMHEWEIADRTAAVMINRYLPRKVATAILSVGQ
jgi:hypothetical protein